MLFSLLKTATFWAKKIWTITRRFKNIVNYEQWHMEATKYINSRKLKNICSQIFDQTYKKIPQFTQNFQHLLGPWLHVSSLFPAQVLRGRKRLSKSKSRKISTVFLFRSTISSKPFLWYWWCFWQTAPNLILFTDKKQKSFFKNFKNL